MKKKPLIVLAVLVLLLLVGGWTAYQWWWTTTIQITGLEAAVGASSFIESLSAGDGRYYFSKSCSMLNASCMHSKRPGDIVPQTSAWASLGFVGLYRASNKDDGYITNAILAADNMISACKADNSTNCDWSLVQLNAVYKETGKTEYEEFILERTASLPQLSPPSKIRSPMIQAIEAREYAIAYSLSGSEKYKEYFENSISAAEDASWRTGVLLFREGNLDVHGDDCWIQVAKLEAHTAFGDSQYLTQVHDFFDNAKISTHMSAFPITTQLFPCVEGLSLLSKITGDKKYADEASKIKMYILINYWDPSKNPKYDGDGSFVSTPCVSNVTGTFCFSENVKTNTDNSYIIYLLATTQPEYEYIIPRKVVHLTSAVQPAASVVTSGNRMNLTHIDPLYELMAIKSSDSDETYVVYYTDKNDSLTSPILKIDGTPAGRLVIFNESNDVGMKARSEIMYLFKVTGLEANTNYEIVLESAERTARTSFMWKNTTKG